MTRFLNEVPPPKDSTTLHTTLPAWDPVFKHVSLPSEGQFTLKPQQDPNGNYSEAHEELENRAPRPHCPPLSAPCWSSALLRHLGGGGYQCRASPAEAVDVTVFPPQHALNSLNIHRLDKPTSCGWQPGGRAGRCRLDHTVTLPLGSSQLSGLFFSSLRETVRCLISPCKPPAVRRNSI